MRSTRTAVGLILVAGLLAGAGALRGAWHFDDYYTIARNAPLRDPASIFRSFTEPGLFSADPERQMYRPVLVVSYVLNYLTFGEDPRWFLLVNLILHLINALLVLQIARQLLGKDEFPGALLAGVLYAVHPAASEGIAYASARSATLATTFVLASLVSYLHFNKKNSYPFLILACVVFVLGLSTKAIAITLPAFALMYHLWFPEEKGLGLRKTLAGVGALAGIGVVYVLVRRALLGAVLAKSLVRPIEENLFTQARAMLHYLRLFLWPIHQSINPYFPTYADAANPQVIVSILVLAALVTVGFLLMKCSDARWRTCSFGLFWMLVAFAPESTIVPLNLVVSERRMILPLAGFCLMAGAITSKARFKGAAAVWLSLVLCMALLTAKRVNEWRSEESVWRAAVRIDPNWGLLWNNMGLIYLEKPDTLRAIKMFELAIRHDPKFKEARLNLGHLYARSGMNEKAEEYYRAALELDPSYVNAAVSLAKVLERTQRGEEARRLMRWYSSNYPSPRVFQMLGAFAENDGDKESALTYYRRAIGLAPFDALSNLALAKLLINEGKREESLGILKKFTAGYPADDAYRNEAIKLIGMLEKSLAP